MAHPPPSPMLRAAGLRQTPQREAILRVLREARRPLTVEEIWEQMGEQRSGLPTVYRNLERFVKEGWAESFLGPDQAMRFLRCQAHGHHHHLQCESCHRVVEVEHCALVGEVDRLESASGFKITRHQLMLFGLCPECQGSPKKTS